MDNITKPLYNIKDRELILLKQAKKEILKLPRTVISDIYGLLDDLLKGKNLSLPISRPLSSIAKGLHELRLSDREGEFRLFYFVRVEEAIYVIHAVQKKTQSIDQRTIELIKKRLRSIHL